MQNSCGAGTIVLTIPTLAEEAGVNTTWPLTVKVPPKNLVAGPPTGVELEYVRAMGSIIPTFWESAGTHIMFPDGRSAAP